MDQEQVELAISQAKAVSMSLPETAEVVVEFGVAHFKATDGHTFLMMSERDYADLRRGHD